MVVVNALWLLAPPPLRPADSCGNYYPIADRLGFMINCDAIDFVVLARSPGRLLDRGEVRQARPLFVVMGSLAGYPFDLLARWLRPGIKPNMPYYAGFLAINVLAVAAAVLVFDWLLASVGGSVWLTALLSVPLLCNDVTKAFFWSAHTQMFNMLGPLLAVAVGYGVATTRRLEVWRFQLMVLGLGVGLLIYGTFIVLLPAALSAYWFAQRRESSITWRQAVTVAAAAGALFLLPTALWVGVVTLRAGSYYNHEMVQYRQLVWIIDAAGQGLGTFVAVWWEYSSAFARTLMFVDILPFLVVAMAAYLLPKPVRGGASDAGASLLDESRAEALEFVCLATFASLFTFFWALGFYERRLTFSIVPPLLCFIGVRFGRRFAASRWRATGGVALSVVAGLWMFYHVTKYGPFS